VAAQGYIGAVSPSGFKTIGAVPAVAATGTTITAGVAEMPMSAVAGHLSAASTLTAGTVNLPMTAVAGNVIRGTTLFAGVAEMPMTAISGVVSGVFAASSNAARRFGMTPSVSLGNRRLN
jgi:hypothetical protein